MRTNGNLYYLTVTGGGLNEYGESEPAEAEWSEAIPCSVLRNRDTSKGVYEDGYFRQVSATVLIERALPVRPKRIRLESMDDDLGEFDVLSYMRIPGQGRYEITV